ncbi:Fc receptor-like protein 2 [Lutra lutra]|uniref:Fc receptor-like protein 2 n=1 Tax=Lutra lutra TaxID=9657 RepID=UPI001FCF980F|nr:Fc receptor-like protein 2 [Lutra lutra]
MPHDVYEGDEVVVRCSGVSSGMIGEVMYYKDESLLATHYHASGYTIPKASPSDSGSYSCEVHQLVFYRFTTERTRAVSGSHADHQALAAHQGELSDPVP